MYLIQLPEIQALKTLSPDGRLLFATRALRMFAYGFLSVVLALYLAEVGLDEARIGNLFTWTLLGDVAISLWIALMADSVGRRKMLLVGTGLMIFAGVVFALTGHLLLLTIAAIIGTISPTGNEVGAFLSIEQAILPQTAPDKHRTQVFAWYNLLGSMATAIGSLCGGGLVQLAQSMGASPLMSYRVVVLGYALGGLALALLFMRLSPSVEVGATQVSPLPPTSSKFRKLLTARFGLHRSRLTVFKLSGLFMLDAFAGGFVIQSWIAYWFHRRYGIDAALLGGIFFGANLLAGLSALAAARLAARFGLINTMVWTHIPSNILLMSVPLMPTPFLAILVLLARFSISQMDVPTRQSYIMAVVDSDERSAAAGVTTIARSAGSAISPTLTGALFAVSSLSAPFFLAGMLKIAYDLLLYRSFIALKPPEEA
jgi:MFS family permease